MTIIQPRKLRYYRRLQEVTQKALGQQLSDPVSQATINRWELGWAPIPPDQLEQLSKILRASPEELLAPWEIPPKDGMRCVQAGD